jgi:sulfur-carrier protein adenylyltransferase/sulfurtransferase
MIEVTPTDYLDTLAGRPDTLLLDVREDWEVAIAQLPGSMHIPMGQIPDRLAELPHDVTIVVYCKVGGRSATVARYLTDRGYARVLNLAGGILAWQATVDNSLATY